MYNITINGKKYQTDKNVALLDYLRDTLKLKGTKNACGQGSCGSCSVIVDGKLTRSCITKIEKLDKKNIVTIEGLTKNEKEVYSYSFAKCGAVQCGFCIPGMVMAAKCLLDKNINPSESDIKKAINTNICRCTGYVKIVDAVIMSASILRGDTNIEPLPNSLKIGDSYPRVDAKDKTLGVGEYVDDMCVEGMLYGGAVRSKYPRAIIKSIDTSKALAHKNVVSIVTAKDIVGKRYIAHLEFISDWPALIDIGETTRYLGDAIVLIAAKNKEDLEEAKKLVEVEYEEKSPIDTIEKSKNTPHELVHSNRRNNGGNILAERHIKRGDASKAIENAKYVVTNHYSLPATEHAFMEPESAIAIRNGDSITIYTGGQNVFDERHQISLLLGINEKKVRCISKYVGGGFGGKEDMSVQHHAALLSWNTNKPVKITMSREESMLTHPKRHPMEIDITSACDEFGHITAVKALIETDTGAYASLGIPVLERSCTHIAGPYKIENIDIEGYAFYTNNVPCGAFRGFGVCQSNFASEINLNQLAKMVGISEWEIRFRNAVEALDSLPTGQIASKYTALKETLMAVKDEFHKNKYVGIACGMKNTGIGMGLSDVGRCCLSVMGNKIYIKSGAACIGQGIATVMLHIASHTLNINPSTFIIVAPDTDITPDSGTTTASRQTLFTGEATRIASVKLKEALKNTKLENLDGLSFLGEYAPVTDPLNSDKSNPKHHVSFAYATQLVILSDDGHIKKVIAAHDVGIVINKRALEGQIEGGVVMSLGYALRENYPQVNSRPQYKKYSELKLLRATEIPEILTIPIEHEFEEEIEAYGAKGIGEISSIPTAAATQMAYEKFDGEARVSLPLKHTPYLK